MATYEDDFEGRNDPTPRDLDVMDRLKELEGMDPSDLMRLAQRKLLADLLAKLEIGQLSHQEAAILRNLLRDNGIIVAPKSEAQEAADRIRDPAALPNDIPEFEDPDE